MVAAVCVVGVFCCALRAHLEFAHGGDGPVVGEVFDDGEARPAVRAVDKRVVVAAIACIE